MFATINDLSVINTYGISWWPKINRDPDHLLRMYRRSQSRSFNFKRLSIRSRSLFLALSIMDI